MLGLFFGPIALLLICVLPAGSRKPKDSSNAAVRVVGILAALGIGGFLVVIYFAANVLYAGGGTIPTPPANVPIQMYGATIANNRINTKAWSFDYDHAQLSPEASTGTVEGIRNGIVFKKGRPNIKISAEKITLDTQSLDFTAIGKVHVEKIDDPQHRSFDTDLVTWTNNAKEMRIDHGGYVHSRGQTRQVESGAVDLGRL
jgi:hypothetical protein